MSQENVEIVRRAHAGVTVTRVLPPELFGAEFELDAREVSPDFGIVQGYEASQAAFASYWETFEDFQTEVEEVLHADDEQVVTAIRDGGRIKGSDADVQNRYFHVWAFRNGRAIRLSIYGDKDRALEAAGLSE
ncbi:MAG: nuclear transport factor 2 family protein [Solirubrobacterales bacterium]